MYQQLAQSVNAAVGHTDACAAVEKIYFRLGQEVNQRQPLCVISGRCCKFEEYGHRLYVTTLELANFLRQHTVISRVAELAGGCPFQVGKLCGVHASRPFGCRIFYCDPSARQWQEELYEKMHGEMKQLHQRYGVEYFYVEWREALRAIGILSSDGS